MWCQGILPTASMKAGYQGPSSQRPHPVSAAQEHRSVGRQAVRVASHRRGGDRDLDGCRQG